MVRKPLHMGITEYSRNVWVDLRRRVLDSITEYGYLALCSVASVDCVCRVLCVPLSIKSVQCRE